MMRKILWLIFLIELSNHAFSQQNPLVTTFILLRHAEKGNDGTEDPDLKPEGIARASLIAKMLNQTSVDAIYSTDYKRTRNTVIPLAKEKGLEVQLYEAFKSEEIEKMMKKYAGG